MTDFEEKVYAAVRKIPHGCVATYGQIARLIGSPGSARAVGNALHKNPNPLYTSCFRIVDSKGRLAENFGYGGIEKQKEMLENDGISVENYSVDLKKYQWK